MIPAMITKTARTGTATATRTAVPRCGSCSTVGGIVARGLYGRCYADGPNRSRFDSAGQRIAEPPAPPRRDDDDTPFAGQPACGRHLDGVMAFAGTEVG